MVYLQYQRMHCRMTRAWKRRSKASIPGLRVQIAGCTTPPQPDVRQCNSADPLGNPQHPPVGEHAPSPIEASFASVFCGADAAGGSSFVSRTDGSSGAIRNRHEPSSRHRMVYFAGWGGRLNIEPD
jgi:hypothetical protein